MNPRWGPLRSFLCSMLWRIGFCVALAGAAILAVEVIRRITEPPEPLVDVIQKRAEIAPQNGPSGELRNKLRFAVSTMVSAGETFSTYRQFVHRISRDIGREEVFVVRPSYEAVRLALTRGEVDVAFAGTGTCIRGIEDRTIKLLVQPEFDRNREYRSLLLVPSESRFQRLEDLQNKVMAFTDRESFTGCLLPSASLMEYGQEPDRFFRKVIYTGSHDRSILAVSTKAVDAASVMSLVWLSMLEKQPSLAKRARILWQSKIYGPPAIAIPLDLDDGLAEALRKTLLSLHEDEEGRKILAVIGIKRFVPAQVKSYDDAMELHRRYEDWLSKR